MHPFFRLLSPLIAGAALSLSFVLVISNAEAEKGVTVIEL
jgi:hypothetical protein